mmetsp:Transcript_50803/g.117982  ORF Transcript_50803/g.117982 Transcript_50803/m.117982 type:complete len:352 (+) Transcript_50803:90-1145(+)
MMFSAHAALILSAGLALAQDVSSSHAEGDDAVLLQVHSTVSKANDRKKQAADGFAFVHMPFNFGNTIEKVAMVGHNMNKDAFAAALGILTGMNSFAIPSQVAPWPAINALLQEGGEVWGHANPDLQVTSNITGCPIYLTPPKYWPADVAEKYIGNKAVVSVLRDPYEKLVAQFRGEMTDYGGSATPETLATCDVNTAVKNLLRRLQSTGDMFQAGCANLPQSEFFEGPYGVTDPIDNWRFPKSANEMFVKYGYPYHIEQADIMHVEACSESWSYDFDAETRALVKEIYAKDFELICKHFGRCDNDANTCLQGIERMCPAERFEWNATAEVYCPKAGQDVAEMRLSMREECR